MNEHTIVYSDGQDEIRLVVPWGHHSGNIPPATITFGVVNRVFVYQGSE